MTRDKMDRLRAQMAARGKLELRFSVRGDKRAFNQFLTVDRKTFIKMYLHLAELLGADPSRATAALRRQVEVVEMLDKVKEERHPAEVEAELAMLGAYREPRGTLQVKAAKRARR